MICSSVKRFFTSNLLQVGNWTPNWRATQNRGDVDLHLTALDKLQERDFEPALGGVKIPLTPNSLPGGGKRVTVAGTSSRDVHVVPAGIRSDLSESIVDKQAIIQTLRRDLQEARNLGNPALIAQNERLLQQELADLRSMLQQVAVYGQEHRRINS
ncbi:hypothetical protein WAE31_10255 (plasmid) [Xanthomonas axonopodis pv. vasculorum]